MLEIKDNRIYLTRGDTAFITISLKDSLNNTYTPTLTDKIYFRLKKNVFGDSLLLVKEINIDTLTLELTPNDTKNLDFSSYCYEIELITASGQCYTVVENAPFIIGPELETNT